MGRWDVSVDVGDAPDDRRRVRVFDRRARRDRIVIVPMRGYVVTRGHGFGLIALYAAYMACVVIVEV